MDKIQQDERDRFQEAIHIMQDAFHVLDCQVEQSGWSAAIQRERFEYATRQAKQVFGDVLLQRDVETIFHNSEGSSPKGVKDE